MEILMTQKRLLSLDAFRGATIAFMVLVNDPGGFVTYPQLRHARWNGWTITDMVFPFSELLATLLWIIPVGAAGGASTSLHVYIYEHFFLPLASPQNASLLFAIAYVLLSFAVAWIMWKRRWFLKV